MGKKSDKTNLKKPTILDCEIVRTQAYLTKMESDKNNYELSRKINDWLNFFQSSAIVALCLVLILKVLK